MPRARESGSEDLRLFLDSSFTDFLPNVLGDGVHSGVCCWILGSDPSSVVLSRVEAAVGGDGVDKSLLKSSLMLRAVNSRLGIVWL